MNGTTRFAPIRNARVRYTPALATIVIVLLTLLVSIHL